MTYYSYIFLDATKPGRFTSEFATFFFEPFYVGKGKDSRIDSKQRHLILRDRLKNSIPIKVISNISEECALCFEKYVIQCIGKIPYGSLLNLTNGGDGTSGCKCSEQRKRKIGKANSIALKGNIPWNKGKHSKSGMEGKTHSKETKILMSRNRTGRKLSEEHKQRLSEIATGRIRSDSHRKSLSDALIGKKASDETRLKLSVSHLGQIMTNETKKKKSESMKRYWKARKSL